MKDFFRNLKKYFLNFSLKKLRAGKILSKKTNFAEIYVGFSEKSHFQKKLECATLKHKVLIAIKEVCSVDSRDFVPRRRFFHAKT